MGAIQQKKKQYSCLSKLYKIKVNDDKDIETDKLSMGSYLSL